MPLAFLKGKTPKLRGKVGMQPARGRVQHSMDCYSPKGLKPSSSCISIASGTPRKIGKKVLLARTVMAKNAASTSG